MANEDFTLSYRIAAQPMAVYNAIATQAGVQHWWTESCQIIPKVGGRALFLFPNGDFYAVMNIVALNAPRLIEWECVDSKHPENSGYVDLHDWIGTHLRFEIAAHPEGGSSLQFTHVGLVPLECAEACTSLWSFFLGQSLKKYLETGKGEPARVKVE